MAEVLFELVKARMVIHVTPGVLKTGVPDGIAGASEIDPYHHPNGLLRA